MYPPQYLDHALETQIRLTLHDAENLPTSVVLAS
jgi:hypothetical protein